MEKALDVCELKCILRQTLHEYFLWSVNFPTVIIKSAGSADADVCTVNSEGRWGESFPGFLKTWCLWQHTLCGKFMSFEGSHMMYRRVPSMDQEVQRNVFVLILITLGKARQIFLEITYIFSLTFSYCCVRSVFSVIKLMLAGKA